MQSNFEVFHFVLLIDKKHSLPCKVVISRSFKADYAKWTLLIVEGRT